MSSRIQRVESARCTQHESHKREHVNAAAVFLYREWLPESGEAVGDFPIFFHYVNVGPEVSEAEMITAVYLPLKG